MQELSNETALVEAASRGDQHAFRELVEPISRELHLYSYRMLGSFHDAEDVLQDSQLKAWQRLETYDRRASFRSWMYKIVTNTSIDALRTRRRRVLPQDLGPARHANQGLGEERFDIPWLEPYPDTFLGHPSPEEVFELRESVRLAFIRALQLLPARQRAVLILRDVLDWHAAEVAAMLETSVAGVNSALQRARATLAQDEPARGDLQESMRLDEKSAEVASRYVRAWEEGDTDAIVSLLTQDAIHSMPPFDAWFVGRDTLRALYGSYDAWGGEPRPGVFRVLVVGVNGQLGFAEYWRTKTDTPYVPVALNVAILNREGTLIAEKVSFVQPDRFREWGLPESLE